MCGSLRVAAASQMAALEAQVKGTRVPLADLTSLQDMPLYHKVRGAAGGVGR